MYAQNDNVKIICTTRHLKEKAYIISYTEVALKNKEIINIPNERVFRTLLTSGGHLVTLVYHLKEDE